MTLFRIAELEAEVAQLKAERDDYAHKFIVLDQAFAELSELDQRAVAERDALKKQFAEATKPKPARTSRAKPQVKEDK